MTHETNTVARTATLAAGLLLAFTLHANAQQTLALHDTPMLTNASLLELSSFREAAGSASSTSLPEAPSAVLAQEKPLSASTPPAVTNTHPPQPIAPKYQVVIPHVWVAQPLNGKDKIVLSLRDSYSPESFLAIFFSAGYEQLTNGSPNYGTDRGAFGERLGAAGIRETSQAILSEGVFAAVFHEDPRYYQLSRNVNVVHRTLYAITRPFITRNDAGHNTLNLALLTGYAATTAMSTAYYPPINRNAKDMVGNYGGSLGGAALGFFVNEFSDQFLEAIHLKKKTY